MATELKVSFSRDMQTLVENLAVSEGVSAHEYIREVVKNHIRTKQSKLRYKALRYAESAAIVMDYIDSDYDLDKMTFTNLSTQQVRNKVVSASNDLFEYANNSTRVEGLRDVQFNICDLS